MMWKTHIIFGACVPVLVGDYGGAVAGIIGATSPDWMEHLPRIWGGRRVAHRTKTHVLVYWLGAVLVTMMLTRLTPAPLWFAVGGLSHVLLDIFTPMGVPLFPNAGHRTNVLGGSIRTGSFAEYGFMAVALLAMLLAVRGGGVATSGEFVPFFPDYYDKYDRGIIDAYELKQNRLRFF